jgi:hypothetical protein
VRIAYNLFTQRPQLELQDFEQWSQLIKPSQASRTVFANLSPTTVMTGNVTQLVVDSVDVIAGPPAADAAALRARIRRFWPPVVAFAVGAACGALGYKSAGFLSLLLPTAIVLGLQCAGHRSLSNECQSLPLEWSADRAAVDSCSCGERAGSASGRIERINLVP